MGWPNARNTSTQHLATLLHDVATCVERGGQTHATFPSFSTQHVNVHVPQAPGDQEVDLTRMPYRNNVAQTWPNEYNIMQHRKCCAKNLTAFRFDPTSSNILQHIATGWANVCNMLCPTMLQDAALKCCERLARPYYFPKQELARSKI